MGKKKQIFKLVSTKMHKRKVTNIEYLLWVMH
uniref:Uncharacterized protein n=1 Tax=Arundo donax TaxID=35708 RepID=A0A0A9B7E9_ARUDO